LSAVFYRLKERCAIFICNGLNYWPLTGRYSHDFNSSHTKPCLAGRQALLFQDYFYRYYKTLPKSIIAEQLGVKPEEVTPEASFVDDLGADSLDTVELVMALEEEFGIEIPDEDAEKITTVGDAVKYIEEKAANK